MLRRKGLYLAWAWPIGWTSFTSITIIPLWNSWKQEFQHKYYPSLLWHFSKCLFYFFSLTHMCMYIMCVCVVCVYTHTWIWENVRAFFVGFKKSFYLLSSLITDFWRSLSLQYFIRLQRIIKLFYANIEMFLHGDNKFAFGLIYTAIFYIH